MDKVGVTKDMVTDKVMDTAADMMDMAVVAVMITMADTVDMVVIQNIRDIQIMVNTLILQTKAIIIHKRVIIISKTNNSKNFINLFFFLSHNQIVFFCGNEDVRN